MNWLAVLAGLTLQPGVAAPPPACGLAALEAIEGDPGSQVSAGSRCGEIVVATDGNDGVFSWGAARQHLALPRDFELSLRWQRLTPDSHRTLELFVPGGAILVRDGSFAFYESDARFVTDGGWRPLPGHDTRALHLIRVRHRDRTLEAWIDDRPLGTYVFTARPMTDSIRVGLKGERGYRGRMRYRELSVRPLSQ